MTTAGDICNRAAVTLFDDTHIRWGLTELVGYLNDSLRELVLIKPSAHTENEVVQLDPGVLQTLPERGVALVDVGGNMGGDGETPGRSVTQIDRTVLEASRPDWRASTASINAKHFIYDNRDPGHFLVYPPQPDPAGHVELVFASVPEAAGEDDPIPVAEIYVTPLYYLVLARAYAKSTGAQDFNKSQGYLQMAHQLITGRKVTKQELHPEQMAERAKR